MNAGLTISTLTVDTHHCTGGGSRVILMWAGPSGVVVVHCQWWCSCDVMRMFVTVLVRGVGTVTLWHQPHENSFLPLVEGIVRTVWMVHPAHKHNILNVIIELGGIIGKCLKLKDLIYLYFLFWKVSFPPQLYLNADRVSRADLRSSPCLTSQIELWQSLHCSLPGTRLYTTQPAHRTIRGSTI